MPCELRAQQLSDQREAELTASSRRLNSPQSRIVHSPRSRGKGRSAIAVVKHYDRNCEAVTPCQRIKAEASRVADYNDPSEAVGGSCEAALAAVRANTVADMQE